MSWQDGIEWVRSRKDVRMKAGHVGSLRSGPFRGVTAFGPYMGGGGGQPCTACVVPTLTEGVCRSDINQQIPQNGSDGSFNPWGG